MNERTPIVWVTHQVSKFDYSKLDKFGEVRFIATDDFDFAVPHNRRNSAVYDAISDMARQFDGTTDFVTHSGSPYITSAVFLALGEDKHSEVRILKWDKWQDKYLPYTINLNH